jgi:hypothetical protein
VGPADPVPWLTSGPVAWARSVNAITECHGYWPPNLAIAAIPAVKFKSNFRGNRPETACGWRRIGNHVFWAGWSGGEFSCRFSALGNALAAAW